MRHILSAVLLVGTISLPASALAERCKTIAVEPEKTMGNHTLKLAILYDGKVIGSKTKKPKLKVGKIVKDICFTSSQKGFISLWSHGAKNIRPTRILPNEYMHAEDDEVGFAIKAGKKSCFSHYLGKKKVNLKVQKPYGQAELYLHFSPSKVGQFNPDDLPTIGNREVSIPETCPNAGEETNMKTLPRGPQTPYASTTIRYEVVK